MPLVTIFKVDNDTRYILNIRDVTELQHLEKNIRYKLSRTGLVAAHHFEDITYEFQTGLEVIPFLAPHEIRQLFGGSSQEITHHHDAVHGYDHTHDHEHSHRHEYGEVHS